MIERNKKILIVGLGLMGGSYAQRLHDIGYNVYAIDIDGETINEAKKEGVIKNTSESDEELISSSDVIILCIYPSMMVDWVKKHNHLLKDNTLLTDISGVKSCVVEEIQNVLKKSCEFISMHPMAGRETKGFKNRDTSIFLPANMIVVPTNKNTKEAVSFAYDLAVLLRFRNVEVLSVEEHDEMIGYLSQLPHAIAVALINCRDSSHLHKYTGDSFRDLTRIAKINESLWSELFMTNKDNLLPLIDTFIDELKSLRDDIASDDEKSLKQKFISSTERRKAFDK